MMTKTLLALVLTVPLAASAAVTPEALRASAERSFGGLIPVSDPAVVPALPPGVQVGAQDPAPAAAARPFLGQPLLQSYPQSAGASIGRMPLSRLDAHKSLLRLDLGGTTWDVSLAATPKFDVQYFAFRQGDRLVLARINNVNDLRKDGVVARLDERTAYRFKVNVNIFSPVRGST
ncbi:MAG: hypothetical protein KGL53_12770, partial [Elusimicrobia bacterium]|nr:hypothetical protein [Elusimicrobiota bacterium]